MVRFELTTYCLGGSRSNSTELHHHLPFCLMVGVGIEPTFAAFQTAANPSQLSDQISVRGRIRTFDLWFRRPTLSSSAELHEQSLGGQSGWQDSNLRRLAPKASGRPLPHTQKIMMEPVGLEPTMASLQDWCLPNLATIPKFQ